MPSDAIANAVTQLRDQDPKVRLAAAKLLFREGRNEVTGVRRDGLSTDECWKALLEAASTPGDAKLAEEATGAIAMIVMRYRKGKDGLDPLSKLAAHSAKQVRAYAARGLGHVGLKGAVPPLMALLEDPADTVVREAAVALGNLSGKLTPAERKEAKTKVAKAATAAKGAMKELLKEAAAEL